MKFKHLVLCVCLAPPAVSADSFYGIETADISTHVTQNLMIERFVVRQSFAYSETAAGIGFGAGFVLPLEKTGSVYIGGERFMGSAGAINSGFVGLKLNFDNIAITGTTLYVPNFGFTNAVVGMGINFE